MLGNFCTLLENAKKHSTLERQCYQTIQIKFKCRVSFFFNAPSELIH